ncbi:hypothetical protein CISIN_1g005735mg [Citrus sinensis]|uniref:DCD domain-containing protein n=1 Tax=Citrus sinensis TaxID=2711 RepID=A0A067FIK4_CITSI|nr:hypothetical protein CISIN_1g005735mg [Citrus sinensis]
MAVSNSHVSSRNLQKSYLGGVIFGCKKSTIKECLAKQLFGLPAQHFLYVRKVDPGLPLFLFNYTDRKLHGIFEAASPGMMNINPYGWTDGSERTSYPAQVQIRVRMQCQPLNEEKFKPIIAANYYTPHHFWFELDHSQASKLIALLSSMAIAPRACVPQNRENQRTIFLPLLKRNRMEEDNSLDGDDRPLESHLDMKDVDQDEKSLILMALKELAINHEHQDFSSTDYENELATGGDRHCSFIGEQMSSEEKIETCSSSRCQSIINELIKEVAELKAFKTEQTLKMKELEQKLVDAEAEIQRLKEHCLMVQSPNNDTKECMYEKLLESSDELHLDPSESIYLPMSSARSYASAAMLNGELYIFGGGDGNSWHNTVESYSPANDEWTSRPSLNGTKGSLAGATIDNKIFAIGGGNGLECFSDVEMLDLDIGKWIRTRSMLQKRFALAAAELNGVLYATGGYDGNEYMNSAERFDPREHYWTKIANMNRRRGCHSLAVLNGKLYALGGFDGSAMVPSIEVYDPRLGSWMSGEPMKLSRGYLGAAVVKEAIYVIGGVKNGSEIVDTVERFKEGQGWEEINSRAIGKRCFMSVVTV